VQVEWSRRDGHAVIVVRGLRSAPDGLVRVQPEATRSSPVATAGSWIEIDDGVCFVPRFPVLAGTRFVVSIDHSLLPANADGEFFIEAPTPAKSPTTTVVALYPNTPTVPRNQLRLYVHFSDTMSEGYAARHVHIERTDTGEILDDALLPMPAELWDQARQRLTVLFDPGRIKRGLVPHEEVGYPLVEGSAIRVVVDAEFRDTQGRPLVEAYTTTYDVGPDQRGHVDPRRWPIDAPTTGSRQPLVAHFDRPLDHGLLQRCISIRGVAGTAVVGPHEQSWSFVPDEPWPSDTVTMMVDPILEDGAGNSVARVFDRDLSDRADDPGPTEPVQLEVTLRPTH
jgi:hypothetical protein